MDVNRPTLNAFAVDMGAGSGRAMLGQYDGTRLTAVEVHRFPNTPVTLRDTVYWDFPRLFAEVQYSLQKACCQGPVPDTVGVDTWGVDFALLDRYGDLLGNPRHYRNLDFAPMMDEVFRRIPKAVLFERTGIQTLSFNTIFQLMYLKVNRPELLEHSRQLLLMPDLVNYFLTREMATEYTIASTTQLLNAETADWADDVLDGIGVPRQLFTPIVRPYHKLGPVHPSIDCSGGAKKIQVVNVGQHDTASAVFAVPHSGGPFAYISSGTWSLVGTRTAAPVISAMTRKLNLTNEGGVDGSFRLLKNVMGLWLLQEVQRIYALRGTSFSFDTLTRSAGDSSMFLSVINPDADEFLAPTDMVHTIQSYCQRTSQRTPETPGEITRVILQSLALKYRWVIEQLEWVTGTTFSTIHIVGGGSQNELLCQWTADATNKHVAAGPTEATVIGNICTQYIASGEVTEGEVPELVRRSCPLQTYMPHSDSGMPWDEMYGTLIRLVEHETQTV